MSLFSSHPFPVLGDPEWGRGTVNAGMKPAMAAYRTTGSIAWLGSNVLGQKGFKLYDEYEFGAELDIFIM